MHSSFIRESFIHFFTQRGHQAREAVPIVNKEDPTLLFVNAGMNPFKEIILGHQPIDFPRMVTIQPCLRVSGKHNDLEEVGMDTYHHTFFEMMGNWSFGDYFKAEAIEWAWELLTKVYCLPPERLYVTVFAGGSQDGLPKDEEAAALWGHYLPCDHILFFPAKDNFWEMGQQGPCGPCSEIHIDIRSEEEQKFTPAHQLVNRGHPEVIEIWNLVFMQYSRQASGQLLPLPHRHVDTGMGFERLAMVLQGKKSTYDTDIFRSLLEKIGLLSGKRYHQSEAISIAMRVIADHLRAAAFAIADGALPSPTQAGYVVRRILRRAIRYGYSHLGMIQPFIYQLVGDWVAELKTVYPHLGLQQTQIEAVIYEEEKAFLKTLSTGLELFNHLEPHHVSQGGVLDGGVAFKLYDTYGFPLDLTLLIAKERGLTVDEVTFHQALEQQKLRSQKSAAICYGDWKRVQSRGSSRFVGYDHLSISTYIVQWRTFTDREGLHYQLVLEETPFYPEGGGQISDEGVLVAGKERLSVWNVQKEHGLIVHTVAHLPTQLEGPIQAIVDKEKRIATACNHTATHLLHRALKSLLGDHVVQKGSLVTSTLLRFDFAHSAKLTVAELQAVQAMVNRQIRVNVGCIERREIPLEEAKAMDAQALFGEKYGSHVRVIAFDDSVELCGGTHVAATGQIGFFKIISETAIAAGVRRIEALTAREAEQFVEKKIATLAVAAALLKYPKDVGQAVTSLLQEKKQLQKALFTYQQKEIQELTLSLPLERIGAIDCVIQEVKISQVETLKQILLHYKVHYREILVMVAARWKGKAQLGLLISEPLQQRTGCQAHLWMQSLAPLIGGQGGGGVSFALAGGSRPEGIAKVLEQVRNFCIKSF